MTPGRSAATPWRATLLLVLPLLVASCAAWPRGVAVPGDERTRVYAAVLHEVRRGAGESWVVIDTLLPAHELDRELREKVVSELAVSPASLARFERAQHAPRDRFPVGILPDARWTPVPLARLEALRAASRADAGAGRAGADGFWTQWARAFPGRGGYVILSPAGFARDGASALVHVRVACGPVCGESELQLLTRDADGTWRTTRRVRLSES